MLLSRDPSIFFRELSEDFVDLKDEVNLFKGTCELWHNFVGRCVSFLRRNGYPKAAVVLGALLAEPHHSVRAGIQQFFARKEKFHYYGMNPVSLTKEQAGLPAVLLLHGNHDNQRAWFSLGKRLQRENTRVVFTLNLPSGLFKPVDKELIEKKWDEIVRLYGEHGKIPKIDLVAHSRGARLALRFNYHTDDWWIDFDSTPRCVGKPRRREEVGKTIILGGRPNHQFLLDKLLYEDSTNKIFHIDAFNDLLLIKTQICIPHSKRVVVAGGHLGLTFSKEAIDYIIQFLG